MLDFTNIALEESRDYEFPFFLFFLFQRVTRIACGPGGARSRGAPDVERSSAIGALVHGVFRGSLTAAGILSRVFVNGVVAIIISYAEGNGEGRFYL